ncbi:MAG: hypothetical protein H8E47_01570 [Anaerolineales bacterium]|nr:hypothetical protein [Anaerolineales bacterium]
MNMARLRPSPLIVILMLSVVLRVGVACYLGDSVPPAKDETSYSQLAARLASGHGYSFDRPWYPFTPAETPTAHWSFLYTAFIAGIYTVFGVHPLAARLVGAVLGGVLLPLMVYWLGRRMFPGQERLALLAAGCSAFYAYFILYAAQLLTETFYIVVLLWSLEQSMALESKLRSKSSKGTDPAPGLTLGLSLGMAALLRQSILPWVVVLFAWLLWVGYRQSQLRQALMALSISGLTLALCLVPFTIRNYLVYDDFLLLNSNAGYAMYSAQHPLHGTDFQAFAAAPLPPDLDRQLNEAQLDRELLRRGLQFVIRDPGRYLLLSFSRVKDYFMFWPSAESTPLYNVGRVISFGLFLPFMIYGLWCSRRDWRRYGLLYGFIAFYSLLHIFTWAMHRYRLPVDGVLMLFAALGLADLGARWFGVGQMAGESANQQISKSANQRIREPGSG